MSDLPGTRPQRVTMRGARSVAHFGHCGGAGVFTTKVSLMRTPGGARVGDFSEEQFARRRA